MGQEGLELRNLVGERQSLWQTLSWSRGRSAGQVLRQSTLINLITYGNVEEKYWRGRQMLKFKNQVIEDVGGT